MTDTQNTDRKPKIINLAVNLPPHKLKGDVECLASFGVLFWPVRVDDLRLVRKDGEFKIWTSTPDIRFMSEGRDQIIEAAMATVRESIESLEVE